MRKMPFLHPVCVVIAGDPDGLEIEDVEKALRFLRGWPADRRGPVYQAAFNACTAAQDGYLTVEEARSSLSGFARITGILNQDGVHRRLQGAAKDPARLAH